MRYGDGHSASTRNLAVKAGLQALSQPPPSHPPLSVETLAYYDILRTDLVSSTRRLVTACRASGQWREDFQAAIEEGNASGGWGTKGIKLRTVELSKDVETRWSSTKIMISKVLELDLAIKAFLEKPKQAEIAWHSLNDGEVAVLTDINQFLRVFHIVQELVSAEKTPTLSIVLPMYEKLILILERLKPIYPNLGHAIDASLTKLREYLVMSRRTKMYSMAMVLNPTIKLEWLKENWTTEEYDSARKCIRECLILYQRDHLQKHRTPLVTMSADSDATNAESGTGTPRTPSIADTETPSSLRRVVRAHSASEAAMAQSSGINRLDNLLRTLSFPNLSVESSNSPSSQLSSDDDGISSSTLTPDEQAAREEQEICRIVDNELQRYESDGLLEPSTGNPEREDFDLVRWWQTKRSDYPLLWRATLDVLPVQASAVSCERVFSSSKETDTLRRANLSPEKMEMLQILKYSFRQDRLNFTDHLLCTEEELTTVNLTGSEVDELISTGRIQDLSELIDRSYEL